MGKKKKVDINNGPLQEVTIGQIKDNKYGWIGTLLLFAVFIAIIYFLPEITSIYQSLTQPPAAPSTGNSVPNNSKPSNPIQDDEEENKPNVIQDKLYLFGTDNEVILDNLKYSNISLVNNTLTLTVTNISTGRFELKDLYMVTFDTNTEEKNILNTIALKGYLRSGQSLELSYEIKEGASYYIIKEITEEDYTYIDLTPDANNNVTLTCDKNNESIIYTFNNRKLISIEDKVTVSKADNDYDNLYNKYNTLVIKYGDNEGVDARIATNAFNMIYSMKIDYYTFSETISNDYYFAKNTDVRVVNFLMESELFECS